MRVPAGPLHALAHPALGDSSWPGSTTRYTRVSFHTPSSTTNAGSNGPSPTKKRRQWRRERLFLELFGPEPATTENNVEAQRASSLPATPSPTVSYSSRDFDWPSSRLRSVIVLGANRPPVQSLAIGDPRYTRQLCPTHGERDNWAQLQLNAKQR